MSFPNEATPKATTTAEVTTEEINATLERIKTIKIANQTIVMAMTATTSSNKEEMTLRDKEKKEV